jgi:hypothetical protein
MRAVVGAAALAASLAVPAIAHADVGHDLHGYYGGERVAAFVIGGMGAAAAGTGGYLVTRDADLARGLGGAWLAMGGLEVIGATFYALQVGGEIDHYEAALARDPAAYRSEEIDHMQGTSSRFLYYRLVELGLTVGGAGVAAYGISSRRDAWTGVGIGVGSLALPLLVIDAFNDARATRYLDEVRRFQPAVGPTAGGGWQLSLGGRF